MTTYYEYPEDLAEKWSSASQSPKRSRSASRNRAPAAQQKPQSQATFVSLKLSNMPRDITIKQLWKAFSPLGTVDVIELFDPRPNERLAAGRISFKPPPKEQFWKHRRFDLLIYGKEDPVTIYVGVSEVRHETSHAAPRLYPRNITLPLGLLEFGSLVKKNIVAIENNIRSSETGDTSFEFNTQSGTMSMYFLFRERQGHLARKRQYKVVVHVSAIKKV